MMIFTVLFHRVLGSNIKFILILFFVFLLGCIPLNFTHAVNYHLPQYCTAVNSNTEDENLYHTKLIEARAVGDFYEIYDEVKSEYHDDINNIFNEQFETLSLPFSESKSEKICTPLSLTQLPPTAVVYQKSRELLRKYECAILEHVSDPPIPSNTATLYNGIQIKNTFTQDMLREIQRSGNALTQTIEMFNEMRTFYPIHRDMLCLVQEMQTYRDALRNFIDQVILWPSKFYNYGSHNQQR